MNQPDYLKAGLWMGVSILSFAAMAVAGRELMAELNTFEVMLYRSVVGFVAICAVLALRPGGFATIRTAHLGLHLKRNAIHYVGQNLWFFAIGAIPLSQLVAIEFTNPIWVALLAPILLAERLTPAKLIAALLGFIGVLIVAQPGREPIEAGHVAAAAAALAYALNTIFTKQIMRFDRVLCVLFWMTLLQGGASLLLSLPGGIPVPSTPNLPWVLVVGLTGITAHYALTSALAWAPATIVAPMDFARLPIVALLGWLLYAEPLSLTVLAGGAVIIVANIVNMRDGLRKGAPAPVSAPADPGGA